MTDGERIAKKLAFIETCVRELRELAQSTIDTWRDHYNHVRPHRSLGKKPPVLFAQEVA